MGTVWTPSSTACLSSPSALVGTGRMLLVSLYYRYLLSLTSSKAGNTVLKIQQNWSFSGQLEIIKLTPEVSCISNKARLSYIFREDPSWKSTSLSTHLLMSSNCLLTILYCWWIYLISALPYYVVLIFKMFTQMLGNCAARPPSDDF